MSYTEEARRRAKEIRQKLRYPPNAVIDHGIDLTRKSTVAAPKTEEPATPLPPPIATIRVKVFAQPPKLSFPAIMTAVAHHFSLTTNDLRGRRRTRFLTMVRHIAIYLGIDMLGLSLPAIGKHLHRDHTSILHGRRKMAQMISLDPGLYVRIDSIKRQLDAFYVRNNRPSTLAAVIQPNMAATEIRLEGKAGIPQPGIHLLDQTGRHPMDDPAGLTTTRN